MSDWYYAAENEQKGPINESELKAQLASNKISGDTLVWTDGMDNWTPANQVPAFSFRAAPEPAKVQPGTATTPASTVVSAGPDVSNPDSTKPVDFKGLMGTPESLEVSPEDIEQNRIFGILAYLGIFVLIPIIVAKDSPFAKYHSNQGLVLFISEIAISVVLSVISIIIYSVLPFAHVLTSILELVYLLPLVLLIMGIINAAAGKCVPLPVIGGIKILK
jgi:uncharacterized membrane protein